MKIPVSKLKSILLYFATHTNPKFLGKTKLMKLIYFLDFMHLKNFGTPVTYDTYINMEHGPIPSTIKNLVDTAADDPDSSILADTIEVERVKDFEMYRITPRRKFTEQDQGYFSETEMEILEKVKNKFADYNTAFIEKASHNEAPWLMTRQLEHISYTLAAKDPDCLVSEEEIKTATEIL